MDVTRSNGKMWKYTERRNKTSFSQNRRNSRLGTYIVLLYTAVVSRDELHIYRVPPNYDIIQISFV